MDDKSDLQRLPMSEEELHVSKKDVLTGKVTVRTTTETHEQILRETLHQESVEVRRVPMEVEITSPPKVRSEGDELIVPIVEERLVVERRLFLIEELRVRKRASQNQVELSVPLRRQRAVVEREDKVCNREEEVRK